MRTIRLILCLLVFGTTVARAQISMTLQVPPMGVLLKSQLWNMVLVNSGTASALVKVNLVLLDVKTSQPVLTGASGPIFLQRGAKQMQLKDFGPIQYTFSGPAFHADADPNGFLPAGSYQACYTVIRADKYSGNLVENCIQMNVDPLSPPLLNTPADEGRIYTSYPQFTWLPPTPPGLFSDLSYTLIVVEVLPGQGKADAIQMNIPVYSAGFVKNLYQNYPASYRNLDTAKLYAWRIVAMNNGQPAAMSDIWTFKVIAPTLLPGKRDDGSYVFLKRDLDAAVTTISGSLKMAYNNEAADSVVKYTISSLTDPGNATVQSGELKLTRGANLLELPLRKSAGYGSGKIYLFRLTNGRNESWTVKFNY